MDYKRLGSVLLIVLIIVLIIIFDGKVMAAANKASEKVVNKAPGEAVVTDNDITDNEDEFYDLPDIFFRDEWQETKNELIVYLINFQKINEEITGSTYFQGFFSDSEAVDNTKDESINNGGNLNNDATARLQFSDQPELISFIDLFDHDNFVDISSLNSSDTDSKNYTSWMTAYRGRTSRIELREKYIGPDRVKQAAEDRLLEIELNPGEISYQSREILSEVSFQYGSPSEYNKAETTVWLSNTTFKNIAVVSLKSNNNNSKKQRYFILQVAAAVIPAESLADNSNRLLAVGNFRGLNKLFENVDIYNKIERSSRLAVMLGNNGQGLSYNYQQSNNRYGAYLYRQSDSSGLKYKLNSDLSLVKNEDLFLSLMIGNKDNKELLSSGEKEKNNYPIIRIGLSDYVRWGEGFEVGVSYFPLNYQFKGSTVNSLWQLKINYNPKTWVINYQTDFSGNGDKHSITFKYLFDNDKNIAFTYGFDYNKKEYYSLSYSFPIF